VRDGDSALWFFASRQTLCRGYSRLRARTETGTCHRRRTSRLRRVCAGGDAAIAGETNGSGRKRRL